MLLHDAARLVGPIMSDKRSLGTSQIATKVRPPVAIPNKGIWTIAPAAPYAYLPSATLERTQWRAQLARRWVQWHLSLTFVMLASATAMIATMPANAEGFYLLVVGLSTFALSAIALRCTDYMLNGGAALLTLAADTLIVIYGLFLLGNHMELFFLLPGSFIIAALLASQAIVVIGSIFTFMIYTLATFVHPLGLGRTHLALTGYGNQIFSVALVGIGLTLLLVALGMTTRLIRQALATEAATAYRLDVTERRQQAKQQTIDADAIALQTELARTLHGEIPRRITTCDELAPLAHMINATAMRIPGLLRDREERLRIEKAIRDVGQALESNWAGFELRWPAPSGTALDRLIAMLRSEQTHP
jgi:hypothetical protein